jgi:AcrR family transcriptional regulator
LKKTAAKKTEREGGNPPALQDFQTRSRLLEAAGRVFAERGYDRATAREICELARVNPAAVNYHFGGKEQLYAEAVREADSRLLDRKALTAILEADTTPEMKIEELFSAILHSLLDPEPSAWYAKLFVREMVTPTKALQEVLDQRVRPNMLLFRRLVAQIMDLPVEHPSVIRGSTSAFSQCMFLFQNRQILETLMPELGLDIPQVADLAHHITLFSLGGLQAVARDAKRGRGAR